LREVLPLNREGRKLLWKDRKKKNLPPYPKERQTKQTGAYPEEGTGRLFSGLKTQSMERKAIRQNGYFPQRGKEGKKTALHN